LAHVYLSEPDFDFQLGNLLADFVRGEDRARMNARFLLGTRQHVRIDAFTDRHPVVRRSRARIAPDSRRFAGILVDIFYDHFLARQWEQFDPDPFAQFTGAFYPQLLACNHDLPEDARAVMEHIVSSDRFGAYQHVEGIASTLSLFSRRLSEHWGRPVDLTVTVATLEADYDGFAADFTEFFPQMQAHLAAPSNV
jgi:acyl carrier protein phosphodiesterase